MSYNIGDIVEVNTILGPQKGKILGYHSSKVDEVRSYDIQFDGGQDLKNVQCVPETQIIGLYREHAEDYIRYIKHDIKATSDLYKHFLSLPSINSIKKVIFNKPATIVLWDDGTKTVVKASKIKTVSIPKKQYDLATVTDMIGDLNLKPGQYYKTTFDDRSLTYIVNVYDGFDPEKGLAMAIAKKALGNKGNYYNEFKKWLPKED